MIHNLDYEEYPHPCLLKVTAGVKYMFIRTKSAKWLFTELSLLQGKYVRQGISEKNMFLPLIEYMHKRNINVVKVDMLIHSENGYAILKEELKQLREHFGSPRCLNPNNEPIMPQWKAPKKEGERGTFNWLTQNEYLNFKKLLKKPIPVV